MDEERGLNMNESRESISLQSLNVELMQLQMKKSKTLCDRAMTLKKQIRTVCNCVKNNEFHYIAKKIFGETVRNNSEYISGDYDDSLLSKRITVYTCIFGAYDSVKEPMYVNENCEYFVFTNNSVPDGSVWKAREIPNEIAELNLDNQTLARYVKTHPHTLFPEYDYSIFIDGNLQIVADLLPIIGRLGDEFIGIHEQVGCDCLYEEAHNVIALGKANKEQVRSQVNQYRNEGFPSHFGLFQTNVLVRRHNDQRCKELMETWWSEQLRHTKRDQLSFTYVLWKQGYKYKNVMLLGPDARQNPRFRFYQHS